MLLPTCGKLVATPSRATPCSASLHQLYAGSASRGTAPCWFTKSDAFSSRVRFATRAAARVAKSAAPSHHGAFRSAAPSQGPGPYREEEDEATALTQTPSVIASQRMMMEGGCYVESRDAGCGGSTPCVEE